jgi:hypothetical protein
MTTFHNVVALLDIDLDQDSKKLDGMPRQAVPFR